VATAAVFAVLAAGLGMWIGLGRAPRHRSFD
jgi:hypothetical protein